MKIVLFAAGFNELIIDLANSLSKYHKIILIIPENRLRTDEHLSLLSESVTYEPIILPSLRNIFLGLASMKKVLQIIRKHDPDVVHIQSNGHLYFFSIFPFIDRPIVNSIHDPIPHTGDKKSKTHRISTFFGKKFTTQYISHSNFTKTLMAKFHGIPNDKIDVIPLTNPFIKYVSVRDISVKSKEHHIQNVLFFGRIWRYKGLDQLIKAEPFVSSKLNNFRIIVAGQGENLAPYKKLISDESKYLFMNYRIPFPELVDLIKSCSFVVLPYIDATQSGMVTLVNSYGKTIIASDVGALSEQIINFKTGLLTPPKNPVALAAAIVKLLQDSSLREKMEKNAFVNIKKTNSDELIAEKTFQTYEKAINSYNKNKDSKV